MRRRDAVQKLRHTGQIVRLTRCQAQRDEPSGLAGQGMNLGRLSAFASKRLSANGPSAARSPDRLRALPPFPPEAERCALMDVLSALVAPTTPEEPDKTWKTSSQTPCLDHRLKRL